MKLKFIFMLLILILALFTLSCEKASKKDINPEEVQSMTTNYNRNGVSFVMYTQESNWQEIRNFISAYNEAKPYDKTGESDHPYTVIIKLGNGEQLRIMGGEGEFQTVETNAGSFNVKGDRLMRYFEEMDNENRF